MFCWFRFLVFVGPSFLVSRGWPTVQARVVSTHGGPGLNFGPKADCDNQKSPHNWVYMTTLLVAIWLLNCKGYGKKWLSRNLRNCSRSFTGRWEDDGKLATVAVVGLWAEILNRDYHCTKLEILQLDGDFLCCHPALDCRTLPFILIRIWPAGVFFF